MTCCYITLASSSGQEVRVLYLLSFQIRGIFGPDPGGAFFPLRRNAACYSWLKGTKRSLGMGTHRGAPDQEDHEGARSFVLFAAAWTGFSKLELSKQLLFSLCLHSALFSQLGDLGQVQWRGAAAVQICEWKIVSSQKYSSLHHVFPYHGRHGLASLDVTTPKPGS